MAKITIETSDEFFAKFKEMNDAGNETNGTKFTPEGAIKVLMKSTVRGFLLMKEQRRITNEIDQTMESI